MHLFEDRLALKAFARTYARPNGSLSAAMSLLRTLQMKRREGFLDDIPETRIEQSFNERLFAELFGYRTLLRDGASLYHLKPKTFHGTGRYDDFSLGFYRPDSGEALVSCELKSPFTVLDKPQMSGNYHGLTPVQQAMRAVANVPSVRWIIVSNFDEIRLYRAGDEKRYEQVFLTDIQSAFDLRQLLALFSKRTLLGDGTKDSLLEQLYKGGLENMIPPAHGRIRLLQHVTPNIPNQQELPFYRLEVALRRGTLLNSFDGPHVVNDRLVFRYHSDPEKSDWVIEATKGGVLQSSEYIETQTEGSTVKLSGQNLLDQMREFLDQATAFYTGLRLGAVDVTWSLDNIAGAICLVSKDWCPESTSNIHTLTAPNTIPDSQMTMSNVKSLSGNATQQKLIPIALTAVRELLYPFSTIESNTGATIRANPQLKLDQVTYNCLD